VASTAAAAEASRLRPTKYANGRGRRSRPPRWLPCDDARRLRLF